MPVIIGYSIQQQHQQHSSTYNIGKPTKLQHLQQHSINSTDRTKSIKNINSIIIVAEKATTIPITSKAIASGKMAARVIATSRSISGLAFISSKASAAFQQTYWWQGLLSPQFQCFYGLLPSSPKEGGLINNLMALNLFFLALLSPPIQWQMRILFDLEIAFAKNSLFYLSKR